MSNTSQSLQTKALIRELQANMEQMKPTYSFSPISRIPYKLGDQSDQDSPRFGSIEVPAIYDQQDKIHSQCSAPDTPVIIMRYQSKDSRVNRIFKDFQRNYGKVTMRILLQEVNSNQDLRDLLYISQKISYGELIGIMPVQLDQILELVEFDTFIESAREHFRGKNQASGVYRTEITMEAQRLKELYEN